MKKYLQHSQQEVIGIVSVNSLEFVEMLYRCHQQRNISVPLRDVGDLARIRAAAVTRTLQPTVRTGWGQLPLALPGLDEASADRIAQILFTSGTTGEPKGIALSELNIVNTVERLNDVMALDGSVREYVGIPVYYSFGMYRCRAVSAVGGQFYVGPNGFDISEISTLLHNGEINSLSAVPSQWRLLLEHSDVIGDAGAAIRWIEIGSQYMSRDEKQQVSALFPNARIVQHYGLTEASRSTFLVVQPPSGLSLESVGRPETPIEIKLNNEQCIAIRGPHVASRKLVGGQLAPLIDSDGWLHTTDLGEFQTDGALLFKGRADDVINCAGVKLEPEVVEQRLYRALGVSEGVAVSRLPDRIRGEGILVVFTPETGLTDAAVKSAAVTVIQELGVSASSAITVRAVGEIPRTQTGKIKRSELPKIPVSDNVTMANEDPAVLAPTAVDCADEGPSLEHRLVALWEQALNLSPIKTDESFFDLGGDSLAAISLMLRMEKAGVDKDVARQMMQGLTIADIAALADQSSSERQSPLAPGSELTQLQDRLLKLWEEALKISSISIHDSFFDLGGDSLSAISLMLSMEKSGIDKDIARKMMEGLTIAQISELATGKDIDGAVSPAAGDPAPKRDAEDRSLDIEAARQPSTRAAIAEFNEVSNFLRGIIILAILASHWLPVMFRELGGVFHDVTVVMAPIFSSGSPTLAVLFGLTISVFYSRQYLRNRDAFNRAIRNGTLLLVAGVVIYSFRRTVPLWIEGNPPSLAETVGFLHGPLIYFAAIMASVPLWMKVLHGTRLPAFTFLFLAIFAYAGFLVLQRIVPISADSPVAQLGINILIGKWALLKMGAGSMLGLYLGIVMNEWLEDGRKLIGLLPYGFLLFFFGIVLSLSAGQFYLWWAFPKDIYLWSFVSYAGLGMIVICSFSYWAPFVRNRALLRWVFDIICCFGILLFPIFVVQVAVWPASALLEANTSLGTLSALLLSVGAFLLLLTYPLRKVYKLYYG